MGTSESLAYRTIDIVLPRPWDRDWSVDVFQYQRGLEELGVASRILAMSVADEAGRSPIDPPGVERLDRLEMARPETWQTRRGSYVLFDGLIHDDVHRAMTAAGCGVIALQDAAQDVDPRRYMKAAVDRSLVNNPSLKQRLRAAWLVAKRVTWKHQLELQALIRKASAVDLMVVQTTVARENWLAYLRKGGTEIDGSHILAIPRPLRKAVQVCQLDQPREEKVVAVGRWLTRQKNAELLLRAWSIVERQHPSVVLQLVGQDAATALQRYGPELERVAPVEALEPSELGAVYASSRVCLVSSRWESYHQVAFEALANGCTVAGVPGLPIDEILRFSDHGSRADAATPSALARAILRELDLWNAGRHEPEAVAAFWRARCERTQVCRQLADALATLTHVSPTPCPND